MSNKVTVFVITGEATSVLASVKEMLATQQTQRAPATLTLPATTPLPVKMVRLADRTIKNRTSNLPLKYAVPANAYVASNEQIRFSEIMQYIKNVTGGKPSNLGLSSFLRNKGYVRLHEVKGNKNTFFWAKKESAIVAAASC